MKKMTSIIACFLVLSVFAAARGDDTDRAILESETYSIYRSRYGEPDITTVKGLTSLTWIFNDEPQRVSLTTRKGKVVILSVNGEINKEKDLTFIPLLSDRIEIRPGSSLADPSTNLTVLLRKNFGETVLLQKTIYETGRQAFYLVVDYEGHSWRFMEGVIQIKCDDNPVHSFTDNSPGRRVLKNAKVTESLFVRIPEEIVNEMAASSKIQLQYYNEPAFLLPDAISNIARLVDAE